MTSVRVILAIAMAGVLASAGCSEALAETSGLDPDCNALETGCSGIASHREPPTCVLPPAPCAAEVYIRADNLDGSCNATLTEGADVAAIVNHGSGGNFACSNCATGENVAAGLAGAYLQFTAANSDEYSATVADTAQPYTMAIIGGTTDVSATYVFTGGHNATTKRSNLFHNNTPLVRVHTGAPDSHGSHTPLAATYHQYVYSTAGNYCADDVCEAASPSTHSTGTTRWIGSSDGGGSSFFDGRLKMLLIMPSECDSEAQAFLNTQFDDSPPEAFGAWGIAAMGDSITLGPPHADPGYAGELATTLGTNVANYGIGGDLVSNQSARVVSDVVGTTATTLLWMGGITSLRNDVIATDIFDDLETGYAAAKADGKRVVCVKVIPGDLNAAREVERLALNVLIDSASDCDAVVDAEAAMSDGVSDPARMDDALHVGDDLHPNDAGAAVLAAQVAAQGFGVSVVPFNGGGQ